jgi:hypothetical protein
MKSFFLKGCFIQALILVLLFFLCYSVISSIKTYEKKHNTTLVREIGKETKRISTEFNKGFNTDTTKVDTLKQK